jgi:hypothetical protein
LPVSHFLERVPTDCPHDLFRDSERASQKAAGFLDTSHLVIVKKENFATRMAALVSPTVGDNRLRHEALQHFMLANDSAALAIEHDRNAWTIGDRFRGPEKISPTVNDRTTYWWHVRSPAAPGRAQ